jgi:Family of unknown function (DUF6454)
VVLKNILYKAAFFPFVILFVFCPVSNISSSQENQLPLKVELPGDMKCHTQGIDEIKGYFFVSCVQKSTKKAFLLRYELPHFTGLKLLDVTEKGMYHPSGLDDDGLCLWNASAHYRQFMAKSKVMCIDPVGFEQKRSFIVNDHIGTVAVMGDELVLINWDSKKFYRYTNDGDLIGKHNNPTGVAYQDCCGVSSNNDEIFCSGSIKKNGAPFAVVDKIVFDENKNKFSLLKRTMISNESENLGREGFTIISTRFLFLPGDYPVPTLYYFSDDKMKNQPATSK